MNCDRCGAPLVVNGVGGWVPMTIVATGERLRVCGTDCPGLAESPRGRVGARGEGEAEPASGGARLRLRPVKHRGKYRIPGRDYQPPPPFPWDAA